MTHKNVHPCIVGVLCLEFFTKGMDVCLNEEFPKRLSRLRQELGVSQRAAAKDLGVSQALLSHYENGVREPGLSFVARVCGYYSVSADYILGITPAKRPPKDAAVPDAGSGRLEALTAACGMAAELLRDAGSSCESVLELIRKSETRIKRLLASKNNYI